MKERDGEAVVVVVAHPDDWQLFAGSEIYGHLRTPGVRVGLVTVTAGDAGTAPWHWGARHCGAVLSVLRALPAWSPHDMEAFPPAPLPAALRVVRDVGVFAGKRVLTTDVTGDGGAAVRMYDLHLPDGGPTGDGFAPQHLSLRALRAGTPVVTLWPPNGGDTYDAWSELVDTLYAIALEVAGGWERTTLYAPDFDETVNAGDHADHLLTGIAAREVAGRMPGLAPVWISMYDVANRPYNLDACERNMQRAAIHAYGGGYAATAAGCSAMWRIGWHREDIVYGGRMYLRSGENERR